jgi:hypothetical protein
MWHPQKEAPVFSLAYAMVQEYSPLQLKPATTEVSGLSWEKLTNLKSKPTTPWLQHFIREMPQIRQSLQKAV